MAKYIDEDYLKTFEGWLEHQQLVSEAEDPAKRERLYELWQEIVSSRAPPVGLMTFRDVPGEYRYAVAVESEESELWLTLWVKRSSKGEFFVMLPRGNSEWDPHTSYHLDGKVHQKGYGHKLMVLNRQPLTGEFRGVVSLGTFYGHGPKSVGAICDPVAFSGVVTVPSGVLGARGGGVVVDLVEPGCDSTEPPWRHIVTRRTFSDVSPNVVITVGCDHSPGE